MPPDRAPGLDGPRNDGSYCFNCGSRDHFAYACPESTRKDPYGAVVFRQRQAENAAHGGAGTGSDNSRSRSHEVVTIYPPPPPPPPPAQYPPPPGNAWGPGGPYPPPASVPAPSPNPYGQPPPFHYPPPIHAQPPPYPPAGSYPPAPGGYRPPAPPFVPPSPAHSQPYGQYGQPPYQPPPPPPPSYGPPPPYAPPAFYAPSPYQHPNPPYPGAPPLGFSGSTPPAPPPSYAPGYVPAAPPVPPPAPAPYPSGSFPPAPHPPGYGVPTPYAAPYPPPPPPSQAWQPDSNSHNSHRQRDRRDKRNDRDKGYKNRNHWRDNDNNQRGRGHRSDAPGPRPSSHSRQRTPKPSIDTKDEKSEASKTETPAGVKEEKGLEDANPDDEFTWYLEKAFMEVDVKPADPVGKPLAAEWNDHPTIPPAYDAKCIKSAFYDPDNPDAFLASVRDTKYWPDLKQDPIFRFRPGMVAVQFTGSHHEYFTYPPARKIASEWYKEREILSTPSDSDLNDAIKARGAQQPPIFCRQSEASLNSNAKRGYHDSDDSWRDAKRARASTGRGHSASKYIRRTPPRDVGIQNGPRPSQADEARIDSPQRPYSRDEYSRSPGGSRLQNGGHLAQRHDSGYLSAHSGDKHRSQRDDKGLGHHHSPPPSVRPRHREASRDRSRGWDRREHGRDRNRHRARSRSYSRLRSPTRSATLHGADSDAESVMSDLEYELLGMARPKKKVAPRKPQVKKPRVQVNEAFSRRW